MSDLLAVSQVNRPSCFCGAAATVALDTRELWTIPALDAIHKADAVVCDDVDHLHIAVNLVHAGARYVVASRSLVGGA